MSPSSDLDPQRVLLRHMLATLAYRGGKALRGSPEGFADFRAGAEVRTPGEILAHMGDLLDWGLSIAQGRMKWQTSAPLPWAAEKARFFAALAAFDAFLASDNELAAPADRLVQGPLADSFHHVGQIALLRRLAAAPMRAEDYHGADIAVGRVGADQAAPKMEFG